jgi:hypothetical protein
MSGFRAVNTTLTVPEPPPRLEETTPTTPRPTKIFAPADQQIAGTEDAAKTPTRDSFGGLAGQKPLPAAPYTTSHGRSDSKMDGRSGVSRESSHMSTKSADSSQDVEMGEDKDGQERSDTESVDADSGRPSKKKKGQRFFCTEFPPCQLSFTRSEHLARHIRYVAKTCECIALLTNDRKHTGERPFQCHCNRRFSRLDNLRQHAQTVHVNEDIPAESLAATGTRFQRQIRTDRVRPPPNRSRASTLGSQAGHSRGHSRNLSSSSITSVSTTSSLGGEDIMRRQTPLAMTTEGVNRARLSLDTYNSAATGSPGSQRYYNVSGHSPGGYATPTSGTFSGSTGSPRFSSTVHSPVSTNIPRSVAAWEPRTPGRRLSVPGNPFTPQSNGTYPAQFISPVPSASGSLYSANSSLFASPTSSYPHSRRESFNASDPEWRRRTWHPNTHTGLVARQGGSALSQYQTPDSSRPAFPSVRPTSQSQVMRLPGIESFDHAPPPPPVPRRAPSPMEIDAPDATRNAVAPEAPNQISNGFSSGPSSGIPNGVPTEPRSMRPQSDHIAPPPPPSGHNSRVSWDSALHNGLTRLDLAHTTTAPRENYGYARFVNNASQKGESHSRPGTAPHPASQSQHEYLPATTFQPTPGREGQRYSDQPDTSRKSKRHAWYNGPVHLSPQAHPAYSSAGLRTSPDGSSSSEGIPTPSTGSVHEYHPAIVHSNGYVESHAPGYHAEERKIDPPPHAQAPSEYTNNHSPQFSTRLPPSQQASVILQQAQSQPLPASRPQSYQRPAEPANDLSRLDALVAVATSADGAIAG